ncbi:MAG: AMP-binding protein [Novosphingobium sp.]|nr:AMP-binding protein [Novosphingobium sp.]
MTDGNFYRFFQSTVASNPSAVVFECDNGQTVSRQQLDALAGRYAGALCQLCCTKGDRIAVQVDKSVQSLALYLACLRAGFCYLPLNTAYRPSELAYFLEDARPAVFFRTPGAEPLNAERIPARTRLFDFGPNGEGEFEGLAQAADADFNAVSLTESEPAALLYTSGTTGRPKGAIISHRAISFCARTLANIWGFSDNDILLHTLPTFHAHGLFVSLNVALISGARVRLHGGFEVGAVLAALPRATVFMGVPTYYSRLVAAPELTRDRCRNLRLFVSGSAPLTAELHRTFEERTGHRILERYGSTECTILCSNPLAGGRRAGSVGPHLPGVELRIADKADRPLPTGEIGMIQARGPGLFSGYLNQSRATKAELTPDGYFRTGDLGWVDPEGYVWITGRAKDVVISGGYNIYPAEVEAVIDELPSVLESAVVGGPHADFGECVVAFVAPRDPASPPTDVEVIDSVKARLANYKAPKKVFVIDKLPRNSMGKILKSELKQRLAES